MDFPETTLVSYQLDEYDVYIGRPTNWGNPFSHKRESIADIILPTVEDCVDAYRKWLRGEAYHDLFPEKRKWILDNLYRLQGKKIACWCKKGKPCHGLVLIELLREHREKTTQADQSLQIRRED